MRCIINKREHASWGRVKGFWNRSAWLPDKMKLNQQFKGYWTLWSLSTYTVSFTHSVSNTEFYSHNYPCADSPLGHVSGASADSLELVLLGCSQIWGSNMQMCRSNILISKQQCSLGDTRWLSCIHSWAFQPSYQRQATTFKIHRCTQRLCNHFFNFIIVIII